MEEEPGGAPSASEAAPMKGPPDDVKFIRQPKPVKPEEAAASSAAGQAGGSLMIPVKPEPAEDEARTPRLEDTRMLADAFRAPAMTMDHDSAEAEFDSRMRRAILAYGNFLSQYGDKTHSTLPY